MATVMQPCFGMMVTSPCKLQSVRCFNFTLTFPEKIVFILTFPETLKKFFWSVCCLVCFFEETIYFCYFPSHPPLALKKLYLELLLLSFLFFILMVFSKVFFEKVIQKIICLVVFHPTLP